MPAPRKTFPVADLRENANLLLALADGPASPPSAPEFNKEFRRGVIAMVQRVLFDTDNYKGFQYLDTEFETEYVPGGSRRILRENYDPTRVKFF